MQRNPLTTWCPAHSQAKTNLPPPAPPLSTKHDTTWYRIPLLFGQFESASLAMSPPGFLWKLILSWPNPGHSDTKSKCMRGWCSVKWPGRNIETEGVVVMLGKPTWTLVRDMKGNKKTFFTNKKKTYRKFRPASEWGRGLATCKGWGTQHFVCFGLSWWDLTLGIPRPLKNPQEWCESLDKEYLLFVEEDQVRQHLIRLDIRKSVILSGMHPQMLRVLVNVIVRPFPNSLWKVMVTGGGSWGGKHHSCLQEEKPGEFGDCRVLKVRCILGEMMEQIIMETKQIKDKKEIESHQYGFTKRK